jgi:chromatin remodeling complex protein RSC6
MSSSNISETVAETASRLPAETEPAESHADDSHPALRAANELKNAIAATIAMLKSCDANLKALTKLANKSKPRRHPGNNNLAKKISLGSELCEVLGIEAGSAMTRGELTRALNEYGKEKKLKDPANGRYMLIDPALASLLGQPEGSPVQLFQMAGMLKAAGKIE